MSDNDLNNLSGEIIGAAIEVHRILGPGLLEHTYQVALTRELNIRGIKAEMEVDIPFIYKGIKLNTAYRADIIVENEIILELKSTDTDNPVFFKQLLTYLRLADKKLGFMINFNRQTIKEGLKRIVNNF